VEIDTSEYCLSSVKRVVYQLLPYKSAVTMMLIYGIGLGMIFRLISKYRVRRTQKQVKNLCKARKIKASQKISTHLLTVLKTRTIMYLEIRKGIKKVLVSRVNTA